MKTKQFKFALLLFAAMLCTISKGFTQTPLAPSTTADTSGYTVSEEPVPSVQVSPLTSFQGALDIADSIRVLAGEINNPEVKQTLYNAAQLLKEGPESRTVEGWTDYIEVLWAALGAVLTLILGWIGRAAGWFRKTGPVR
jgi:hypothetical protein